MCETLVPSSVLLKRTHVHFMHAEVCLGACKGNINLSCHSIGDNYLTFLEIGSLIGLESIRLATVASQQTPVFLPFHLHSF